MRQTALCLETMAGQGSNLGHRFEQLAQVLETTHITDRERLGACFDPCHVFAAGYDLRSPEAYAATMAEFDATIGLEAVKSLVGETSSATSQVNKENVTDHRSEKND